MRRPDYVVVGGGILGLFTAWELAKRKARVRILERGRIGREASWAGAGILSPLRPWLTSEPVNALARWSQQHYSDLASELQTLTGIDCEWTCSGMLVLANATTESLSQWLIANPTRAVELSPTELQILQPDLRWQQSAWHFRDVAQVRNPRLLQALTRACLKAGVELSEFAPVSKLRLANAQVRGVESGTTYIECENVVVCAGPWTAAVLSTAALPCRIEPVKGQMLLYHLDAPKIGHIVVHDDRYVVPRRDGHVLVGSSVEYTGFDARPSADIAVELQSFASELFPALGQRDPLAQWAAIRPAAPHGVPVIGRHPDIKNLYMNSGHFRNGVTLAPGSARLLADLAMGAAPILAPSPFAWPS